MCDNLKTMHYNIKVITPLGVQSNLQHLHNIDLLTLLLTKHLGLPPEQQAI